MILPLGAWVIRQACRQLKQLQDLTLPPIPIAVNISPLQFLQDDLFLTVSGACDESGVSPEHLTLEITESSLVRYEEASATLAKLSLIGVRVALDDFGTGYASFACLRHLKLDTLKIDRSFVSGMGDGDTADLAVVSAIIALAQAQQLAVIAEGVEKQEQLDELSRMGCEFGQGFLFSEPIGASQLTELLRQQVLDQEGTPLHHSSKSPTRPDRVGLASPK